MNKTRLSRIYENAVKTIAFLLLFVLLFQWVSGVFRDKTSAFSIAPIYDLPKNSIDVLLVGSSHMENTISPLDLWHEYGITSFNASVSAQVIPQTYFELRELLKVQLPKVVILELYTIVNRNLTNSIEKAHWTIDPLRKSADLIEAIREMFPDKNDRTEFYVDFYAFHNRWKSLKENDFQRTRDVNMGASLITYDRNNPVTVPKIVPANQTKAPPANAQEYLNKIISLCRENGISLVLMTAPFVAEENLQKEYNYVYQVAEEEDIPYYNYFHLLDEIGFDFEKDMGDTGHLNYSGIRKVTSHMGQILRDNYFQNELTKDPALVEYWNEKYATYECIANNYLMHNTLDLEEYLIYITDKHYIIAWSAVSNKPLVQTCLPDVISMAKINAKLTSDSTNFIALTEGSETRVRKNGQSKIEYDIMINDTLFTFGPGLNASANPISIHVGRGEHSKGKTGLNITVYDPITRKVVDCVNVDLETLKCTR